MLNRLVLYYNIRYNFYLGVKYLIIKKALKYKK